MILQTFQTTLPNVYRHLLWRDHFCDYLLQTGIFTNPELDREHHRLYDRILNHYLERYQHRELFGRNGEPDHLTNNSVESPEEVVDLEELSLIPHKNGQVLKKEKGDLAVNVCNLIINSEDFPSWRNRSEDMAQEPLAGVDQE